MKAKIKKFIEIYENLTLKGMVNTSNFVDSFFKQLDVVKKSEDMERSTNLRNVISQYKELTKLETIKLNKLSESEDFEKYYDLLKSEFSSLKKMQTFLFKEEYKLEIKKIKEERKFSEQEQELKLKNYRLKVQQKTKERHKLEEQRLKNLIIKLVVNKKESIYYTQKTKQLNEIKELLLNIQSNKSNNILTTSDSIKHIFNLDNSIKKIDDSFFNKIYSEYFTIIQTMAQSILNLTDVEDVVQEVFIRIYTSLSKYNPSISSLSTWVHFVSRNVILDYNRTVKNNKIESLPWYAKSIEDSSNCTISNIIVEYDNNVMIEFCNNILSKEEMVILIYNSYGFTNIEISNNINSRPELVKSKLYKARMRIKDFINHKCKNSFFYKF